MTQYGWNRENGRLEIEWEVKHNIKKAKASLDFVLSGWKCETGYKTWICLGWKRRRGKGGLVVTVIFALTNSRHKNIPHVKLTWLYMSSSKSRKMTNMLKTVKMTWRSGEMMRWTRMKNSTPWMSLYLDHQSQMRTADVSRSKVKTTVYRTISYTIAHVYNFVSIVPGHMSWCPQ